MPLLDQLRRLSLLVVTGKGGVGKSTLTATLGRILARSGKRVLLLEVDPRESLYQLLGVPPLGGSISGVEPGLYVQNVRPRDVVDELIRERLRVEFLVNRVLASSVYQHFVEGAPGLKQMAVLGYALRVVNGESAQELGRIDLVILDAPATGHGVSMLAAPLLVAEAIPGGPVGELSVRLAEFTADPTACGVAVVSLAEEMPVTETLELLASMEQRLDRRPELIAVNGLYPPPDDTAETRDPELQPTLELWRKRHRVNRRERNRLTRVWNGPLVELPMVPFSRGPQLVDALRQRLELALTATDGAATR
jgi:anion-transporting  ArsA/GET3 family ATPase